MSWEEAVILSLVAFTLGIVCGASLVCRALMWWMIRTDHTITIGKKPAGAQPSQPTSVTDQTPPKP